ncbi:MAG: hypothetical protein NTY15_15625 [Planctomycetota bacterium]|jgi:hypothetical protein|nr:hypothetical protein [Planctomycetota bacterium]
MARLSWVQRLYWRYLSKPVSERALFLHVIDNPFASILEIGIGSGERIKQVLPLCTLPEGCAQIRYVGVDAFESAGPNIPHMNLKSAHRMLAEFGVKAHLIPGDPTNALARVAHTVLPSDLIVIDGIWGADTPQGRAVSDWLPRLCHSKSTIFASSVQGGTLQKVALPAAVTEQSAVNRAA